MHSSFFMWFVFLTIIVILLLIDLGIFHKKAHEIDLKHSLIMSGFFILLALLFGLWVWYTLGATSFAEYLTGYLVEESLSLDNIFVISFIFSSLSIPTMYQHRVLFLGIIGVLVLRAIMIFIGIELVENFHWILYLFSLFILLLGIKILVVPDKKVTIENNRLLKFLQRHLKITDTLHGQKFFVWQVESLSNKKMLYVTPLFVALVLIEFADLIFALDSVPAIFTITQNTYIVYTSNIFAILGLRSLYFSLAAIIKRFYYLKFSLAMILIFIGAKIFVVRLFNLDGIPPFISLGVIFTLLLIGGLYSWYSPNNTNRNS